MQKKILVDLSTNNSPYSGVSRYAINIIHGFSKNGYNNIIILASPLIFDHIKSLFPQYECIKAHYKLGSNLSNIFRLSKQVNGIKCDVIFCTVPGKFFLFCKKNIVQTIHDLAYFNSRFSISNIYKRLFMPLILIKSKKIISISKFVKEDIRKHYGFISQNKIKVIYNSVVMPKNVFNAVESKGEDKYILFVSRLVESKNILTLLKAFNRIKNSIDLNLKLVGTPTRYWNSVLHPYIIENNLKDRVDLISKPLSEQELIELYQKSDLLVHPSIAEGFGYTPIEAAILKTPVITTRETALYETTLGLLDYYDDPFDDNELANHILDVLKRDDSNKKEYISKKLSDTYDYEKISKEVYEYIINI